MISLNFKRSLVFLTVITMIYAAFSGSISADSSGLKELQHDKYLYIDLTNKIPEKQNEPEAANDEMSGNHPSNLWNGTFMLQHGKYLYAKDEAGTILYRYNPDGTGKTKILEARLGIEYLNIQDDWLYYADMSRYWRGDSHIYKIRLDGSGQKIEISDKRVFNMTVSGDWIYYTSEENDSMNYLCGPIHRMRTDGTDESYVEAGAFDYAYNLNVVGDWIYYLNAKDGGRIYRIKKDGSNKTKLANIPASSLNVSGDKIYFLDEDVDGRIRYMNLDGTSMRQLGSFNGDSLLVSDGTVFYTRGQRIYKISEDGSEIMCADRISSVMPINIAGEYIYYYVSYISKTATEMRNLFEYPKPYFEGTYRNMIRRVKIIKSQSVN